ncbi:MAG: tetratricopeptide repeat protein [Pseudomonadota bacterium]
MRLLFTVCLCASAAVPAIAQDAVLGGEQPAASSPHSTASQSAQPEGEPLDALRLPDERPQTLLAATGSASAPALPPRTPGLADTLFEERRTFLPMPVETPMRLPQQEAPGVRVSTINPPTAPENAPDDATESTTENAADGGSTSEADAVALAFADPVQGPIPDTLLRAAAGGQRPVTLSHYAYGAFQRGLYSTAFNVALRASADDDPAAAALIGRLYEEAKGIERDAAKAAGWYAVAADLGSADAMARLGLLFQRGEGVPRDPEKAAELFGRAADKGHAMAAQALALMLMRGDGTDRDPSGALKLMQQAAEAGDPSAQFTLAGMYADGEGTVPDDKVATLWYGRAAESGDPSAALAYGQRLLQGIGTEASPENAAPFLGLAARATIPVAMNLYARVLADTGGDAVEAVKWHLLARAAGVSDFYLDGFMGTRPLETVDEARERALRFVSR